MTGEMVLGTTRSRKVPLGMSPQTLNRINVGFRYWVFESNTVVNCLVDVVVQVTEISVKKEKVLGNVTCHNVL